MLNREQSQSGGARGPLLAVVGLELQREDKTDRQVGGQTDQG